MAVEKLLGSPIWRFQSERTFIRSLKNRGGIPPAKSLRSIEMPLRARRGVT
jgi:hypothetical protein